MTQTTEATLLLLVMILAFTLTSRRGRIPDSLAILAAAAAGILLAGFGLPDALRHLVEGSFTFLPIVLIIYTAQVFIHVQSESGALSAAVRDLVRHLHRYPRVLIVLLMFLVILPGALTGPGAAGQFAFGSLVASILGLLGLPRTKVAAFIGLGGTIGIFAPPVNVPAMIIAAGINMPYLGFFMPLLILTVPLAIFSALYLGLPHIQGPLNLEDAWQALPPVPTKMHGIRVYMPLMVVIGLMLLSRVFPHALPPLGIPLMFLVGAGIALVLSPHKLRLFRISEQTFQQTLEVNAILITVGALVQVMAASGVRGWFVITSISMPPLALYLAMFVICFFLGGVLGPFAVASVFGIPFMLALLGRDPIMATVGLSILASVSSLTPPTAILGKSAMIIADCQEPYGKFLNVSLWPTLALGVAGLLLVIFANAAVMLRF